MNIEKRNEIGPEERERIILKPCLIILSGVPLTGKTVLAEKLVDSSNLETIDVDAVRNEIDELRKIDESVRMLELSQEKETMVKSYTEMCKRAKKIIDEGNPVLITGTFSRKEFKQPLEELADSLEGSGIPIKAFLLTASYEDISARIEERKKGGSLSNIDSLEKYSWAKGIFEKINFVPLVEVDTSRPDYVDEVVKSLEDFKK